MYKIDIVNMNNIPMKKTIELMKNENGLQKKIVAFIKEAKGSLHTEDCHKGTSCYRCTDNARYIRTHSVH